MLAGVAVEVDDRTGLALRAARVAIGPGLSEARPSFWESGRERAGADPP